MNNYLLAFLVFFVFAFTHPVIGSTSPSPSSGVLDLTFHNFTDDEIVTLDNKWELYWNQLLSPEDFQTFPQPKETGYIAVPSFWKGQHINTDTLSSKGYATYRLRVHINTASPQLGLAMHGLLAAHRLWVNGTLVSEQGKVAETEEYEELGSQEMVLITLPPPTTASTFEFILQVSNHSHWSGGVQFPIRFGSFTALTASWEEHRFVMVFIATTILLMGLYHLILFFFRPKESPPLYFAIFCLLWALQTVVGGFPRWMVFYFFPGFPPLIDYYIDTIAFILLSPVFLLFLKSLYPDEMPKILPRLYLVTAVLLVIYVVFSSEIRLEGPDLTHFMMISSMFIILFVLIRARLHNRPAATIHLIGISAALLAGFNDMLIAWGIIDSIPCTGQGLLFLMFCQSCALGLRTSQAFSGVENLTDELEEKNRNLARLDKLKDEFLANTSHELRTPISGIIGLSEYMLTGATGKLSAAMRHNLSIIVTSGKRLTTLVNDLLDYSYLKNKELSLTEKPLDLRSMADAIVTVMDPLARDKGLQLYNNIAEDVPPVWADEDRLQQILYNLVGNGIKFTHKGAVSISAHPVETGVEVQVSDTGIGIPVERLDDIFIPFEQVDGATDRKYGGVGLGLSITRQLVELHGGSIHVNSFPGEGSIFSFTLPQTQEDCETVVFDASNGPIPTDRKIVPIVSPLAEEEESSNEKVQKNGTILVVDDEPVNLLVAHNHLTEAGYNVFSAVSGEQALEMITPKHMPDLILLDIMMPGMNGYDVCKRVRETYSASKLPIIFLTAKNRLTDLVKGFDAGANDYLAKPFLREELLSRVLVQLQMKRAFVTLAENARLKEELGRRAETVRELRVMQKSLSGMLDSAPDPLLVINEADEITFVNQLLQERLGYSENELLGLPVGKVTSNNTWQEKMGLPDVEHDDGERAGTMEVVEFKGKNSSLFSETVLLIPIEHEDTLLWMMILRPQSGLLEVNAELTGNVDHPAEKLETVTLIEELNRNRKLVRNLEASLNGSLPEVLSHSPEFSKTIKSIDTALDQMGQLLGKSEKHFDGRQLTVEVMQQTLTYWQDTTEKTKGDLARESTMWKVYTNMDGWERTQTLDKYLDIKTIPQRPRIVQVIKTGDFVLAASNVVNKQRNELERSIAKLRLTV